MTIFFPDINRAKFDTHGEWRFATRLFANKLGDDCLCWLQAVIGSKQQHPDCIIMHQKHGILVLEVKDWKLNTIRSMDRLNAELLTGHGLKNEKNPLEQARQYATAIVSILEHDPLLVQQEGKYKGHLLLPWGYGAVLTNITRCQFEEAQLSEAMSGDLVICQDEMAENVETKAFWERLWKMFQHGFKFSPLSQEQIDRVRGCISPAIRICQHGFLDSEAELDKETWVRVMDCQQEKIARNLGGGHQIIYGAAGSGKTMLLIYRCLQLHERYPGQPILVLCYNINLAAWLSDTLRARGVGDMVQVRHFHGWCKNLCKRYLKLPAENRAFEKQVEAVIAGVEQGCVPRGQYAAILIDEGQDFQNEWFSLLVQMLNPETNSLLILYDDAQSIYCKRRQQSSFWASVGIKENSKILDVNYRNTIEVLDFSYRFLTAYLNDAEMDGEIPWIHPIPGGRHGSRPLVQGFAEDFKEQEELGKWLQERAKEGIPYEQMAVLSYSIENKFSDDLVKSLRHLNIPVAPVFREKVTDIMTKSAKLEPGIRLMTMHGSKGLEFKCVAICNLGCMSYGKVTVEKEAKVLYVAMTRATEQLWISYHKESTSSHRESTFPKRCEELAKR